MKAFALKESSTVKRFQAQMATTNPSLPEELILEIISRLPQKTIGKCKCLSKSYLSLISKPQFLNLCLTHQPNLILISPDHSIHLLLSTPLLKNDTVSRKLELPGSWTQVVGSCNGLVLLTDIEGDLYVVNPVSNQMSKIPRFDLSLKKDVSERTCGFGYDDSSDDYKIVTLSYYKDYNAGGCRDIFVDVYSVRTGVWKRGEMYPFERFMLADGPLLSGVFVKGGIHWLTIDRAWGSLGIVVKFDLAKDVFYDLGAPEFLHAMFKSLVGRGGRLCGVSSFYRLGGGDVWTMEENGSMEDVGMMESWKKFTIPGNEGWPEVKPVCFVGEEGIVLRAEDGRLFVFDVKDGMMKEFVVDGVPASCMDMGIGSFGDCLV